MSELLIAEDDERIRHWISVALRTAGHHVRTVADGASALNALAEHRPDLMILDVMMPRMSGWDVCAEIRKRDKHLPILMISAKTREEDKVLGLTLGADDYLPKPFGLDELRARVTALIRRASLTGAETNPPGKLIGRTTLDIRAQTLTSPDGTVSHLSRLETGILEILIANRGSVVSRERLIDVLWGDGYKGTTRTLDTRIGMIRRKLAADASQIESVYGQGYRCLDK